MKIGVDFSLHSSPFVYKEALENGPMHMPHFGSINELIIYQLDLCISYIPILNSINQQEVLASKLAIKTFK